MAMRRDSYESSVIPSPPRRRSSISEVDAIRPSPSPYSHEQVDRASTLPDKDEDIIETVSIPSVEPRSTPYKAEASRDLNIFDVASLIINKMVGSGIFTGPFTVLLATQNKAIAVLLWVLGFIYTVFSMWVYLEYARDMPYTGGELVYLDYVFSRFRMLAYTLYAFYFVFLYTTSVNSMRFGEYVLLAANPDADPSTLDPRLVRYLAVSIAILIALLLYFSNSKSRLVNNITALAKILLLVVVLIAAAVYAHTHGSASGDWLEYGPGKVDWVLGVMTVFFGYHGWDNAVLVAGEVPNYKILRNGFYLATLVVGFLYISISVALCFCFSWTVGAGLEPLQTYFPLILGGSRGAKVATAIIIAISASSSNLSVSYTSVRVKQSIGWANILPASNIWAKSAPLRQKILPAQYVSSAADEAYIIRRGTPEGGIILNLVMCIFWIIIPSGFHEDLLKEISFPGSLLIYGHFIVEAFVGFGFSVWYDRLRNSSSRERPANGWIAPPAPSWLQPKKFAWFAIGTVTVLFSVAVVVCAPIEKADRAYVYVNVAVFFAGLAYWFGFVRCPSANKVGKVLGYYFVEQRHGIDDEADPWRQCSQCSNLPRGAQHRHREDGYVTWNAFEFDINSRLGRVLKNWLGSRDAPPQHEAPVEGYAMELYEGGAQGHGAVQQRYPGSPY